MAFDLDDDELEATREMHHLNKNKKLNNSKGEVNKDDRKEEKSGKN